MFLSRTMLRLSVGAMLPLCLTQPAAAQERGRSEACPPVAATVSPHTIDSFRIDASLHGQADLSCENKAGLAVPDADQDQVAAFRDDAITLAARYSFGSDSVRWPLHLRDAWGGTGRAPRAGAVRGLWPGAAAGPARPRPRKAAAALSRPLEINGTAFGVTSGAIIISRRVNKSLRLAVTGRWLDMKQVFADDEEEQNDLHFSASWSVDRNTTLRAEFLAGTGTQSDGSSYDTDQVRVALRYDF